MSDVEKITPEDYALHQGKRYSKIEKDWLPVTEIRLPSIGRQLVGFINVSDGYVFGTAELVDGSMRGIGWCTLDAGDARERAIAAVIELWAKEAGY
jgi:hypothetical protein